MRRNASPEAHTSAPPVLTVNGIPRQRPRILGYVRFDGAGGFNPNFPSHMVNRVLECAAPGVWNGANKILFR